MSGENFRTVCFDKACGWNSFSKTVGCSSGDGSCLIAEFLSADESDFHTSDLIKATEEIREILSGIPPKDDRKLALLNTPFGVMLAWAEHDIDVPGNAVNFKSPPEEIINALGITGVHIDDARAY